MHPLSDRARRLGPDVEGALALARELSPLAAGLGRGGAADYLGALAALGEGDLTVARVVEPHLDAVAILHQAAAEGVAGGADGTGLSAVGGTWGVFAAHPAGASLRARSAGGGWRLDGDKPWCSLADRLTHAVVTADVGPGARRAFAVELTHPGVTVLPGAWVSRGLTAVTTGTVRFDDVRATPVGPDGWYVTRPGFAWGGIGVAAVWVGASRALAGMLRRSAERRPPDQLALAHVGRADEALWVAGLAVAEAARTIDGGTDDPHLAPRVRAVAARAAEDVLAVVGHALGPGPLTGDEEHARRVADLTVYVRQHHAERDLAAHGAALLGSAGDPP